MQLGDVCRAIPLPPLGASRRIESIIDLFDAPAQQPLRDKLKAMEHNEKLSEPITAILIDSKLENMEAIANDFVSPFAVDFDRARNALGLTLGEAFEPFAIVVTNGTDVGVQMILPRAKGIHIGSVAMNEPGAAAKINEANARRIVTAQASEVRYQFLLDLYLQATRQADPRYRAVHLFTCLEALAAGQFDASGSRDSIRMFLGYGYGKMFPYFQIGKEQPINIDHISIVGKTRDQIFHGFSTPQIAKSEAEGYKLFERNPGMFALILAFECMTMLTAGSHVRPEKPANAKKRLVPDKGYRWHIVADEDPKGRNLGVFINPGEERGTCKIAMWIRDYTGGGPTPFKIAVPGGREGPSPLDKLGYGIELIPFDEPLAQEKN
tara:strand:- start:347 stop:1486 length:1140 start_codon:yes stop_codon:yes gene_type:complete